MMDLDRETATDGQLERETAADAERRLAAAVHGVVLSA
jgi:hypothetical protein